MEAGRMCSSISQLSKKAGYARLPEGAKISYELAMTRAGKTAADNLRIG
jgi:hypothetical protein